MHNNKIYQIFCCCCLFFLVSCVASIRTTSYFDEVSEEYLDFTQPINLDLEDYVGPKSIAFFVLQKNRSTNEYFLKLRWNLVSKYRPSISMDDSLKFMIDDRIFSNFSPIKSPQILKINVDPRAIEEEAIYQISRDFIETCLRAEKVKVFVTGAKLSLKADLSSKIHKLAFKDFLEFTE